MKLTQIYSFRSHSRIRHRINLFKQSLFIEVKRGLFALDVPFSEFPEQVRKLHTDLSEDIGSIRHRIMSPVCLSLKH